MPTYTYRCPTCKEVSDVEKSMLADHQKECPVCSAEGLIHLVGVPTVIYRGSGFYTTDKVLDEITDPEYQLSEADQIKYFDEKLKEERTVKVFT